jgi:hypothetical protein
MKPMEKEARDLSDKLRVDHFGLGRIEIIRLALVATRNAKGEECALAIEPHWRHGAIKIRAMKEE